MKVLFGVASLAFPEKRDLILDVERTIKALGHELLFDGQKETAIESKGDTGLDAHDWRVLCQREIAAAKTCDVAIFDVTDKATFGIGFMASVCLERDIPTLFLLSESSLGGSFICGLERPALTRRSYNKENAESVVAEFLKGLR